MRLLDNIKINKPSMTFKDQKCYYELKRIILEILYSNANSPKANIKVQIYESIIYQFKRFKIEFLIKKKHFFFEF